MLVYQRVYINCSYIHVYTAMLLTTSWHSAALKSDIWVVGVAGVSIIVWSEKSKEPRNEDPQQEGPLKYWRINLLVFIKPRSEGKDLMAINLLRLGIHFSSGHAGQLWRLATCQRIPPGLPIQTRWSAVTFSALNSRISKDSPKALSASLGYVAIWSNLFWGILWDGMSLQLLVPFPGLVPWPKFPNLVGPMPLRAPLPGVDQHIQGSQHLDDALAAIGNSGAQVRIVRLFSYLQWDKRTWTEHKVWQARFDWGHKPRPSDKGSTYGAHMEHIWST